MIEDLYQLIVPISRYSVDFTPFLSLREDSQLQKLFSLVTNGEEGPEDEVAAKSLGFASGNSQGYKSLCYRLRDRLLDALLYMPYKKGISPLREQILDLQKRFVQCQVLTNNLQWSVAIPLFERLVQKCLKYEQYHLAYLALPYLAKYYAYQQVNEKKWRRYEKMLVEIKHEVEGLDFIHSAYNEISHLAIFKAKSHLQKLSRALGATMQSFEEHGSRYNSYVYITKRTELEQYYLLREQQYNKCLEVTNTAIERLSQRPFFNRSTRYQLSTAKIDAMLNLKQYDASIELLDHLLTEIENGSHNWYKVHRQKAILLGLQRNYDGLHDLTLEILQRKDLSNRPTTYELWRIIEAYVVFLVRAGKVDRPESKYHHRYRLGKFLNEVPTFSKNKQGLNTTILIAQVLYYAVCGRMDKVDSRIESMNKYAYRHLRKDETYRTNCILKMLMRLPDAEFQPQRTSRYVNKYYNLLQNSTRTINTDVFDPEIIPYEDIWDALIDQLPIKGYRRRKATSSAQ